MQDKNIFLPPAKGPVPIRMSNDYLFRSLLQSNKKVLTGLICSLLHLDFEDVRSVEVTNPIELGTAIIEKTFLLDVKILLNNSRIINLEMQVLNEHNWPERSLTYLCRSFNNLERGAEYIQVKPVVQIGLLDFTLFPDSPEFYATYQFQNAKNFMLYSDKLRLSVVDLTRIDLATEEDKRYHIDEWARLFKAKTWEEIHMLAKDNEYIQEASTTVYKLTQEEKVRLECEAREDYYRRQKEIQRRMRENEETMKCQEQTMKQQEQTMKQQEQTISQLENALNDKDSLIHSLRTELALLQKAAAD